MAWVIRNFVACALFLVTGEESYKGEEKTRLHYDGLISWAGEGKTASVQAGSKLININECHLLKIT